MPHHVSPRARAFALVLAFAPLSAACRDHDPGTGLSASGGSSPTGATAGQTETSAETAGGSETMSEETGSGSNGSASGTTAGTMGSSGTSEGSSGSSGASETGSTSAGGTTGGDTSASGGTTAADKVPCDSEEIEVLPVPPSVLLVLDKSGSMSEQQWDHDNDPGTLEVTRWYSLHEVVKNIVTSFDDVVHFGLKLYPKIDATPYINMGACEVNPGVDVPVAPMNAQGVLAGIPAADFEVLGGTPMETGLKHAYTYLKSLDPTLQRFAIMVADGEISDTCPGENFLEAQALTEEAFNVFNIPTYVVGIDVDQGVSDQLAGLAVAGGKPKPGPDPFYEAFNQLELDAAIQQIVKDTLSCTIAVDPAPSEPALFEVEVGGMTVPQAASCDQDGWVWTAEYSEIELCGAACDMLKETGKVKALYFCKPG